MGLRVAGYERVEPAKAWLRLLVALFIVVWGVFVWTGVVWATVSVLRWLGAL